MENSEDKLAEMFKARICTWKKSQIGQTSGYEYERSFAEMMQEIEEGVFKERMYDKFPFLSNLINRK